MIKAVIFDLDGVLIDSQKLHWITWNKQLEKYGVSISYKDFSKNYFGMRGKDILGEIAGKNRIRISDDDISKAVYEKNVHFRQLAGKTLKTLPGAENILKEVKNKNYRTALATSTTKEVAELVKQKTGFGKYLDETVCASDVTKGKPNPEMFLKAAKKLKINPGNCVVIEDAPQGIEAAKRAGMKCIAVTTTHKPSDLAGADMIVKDLTQLDIEKIRSLEND